MDGITRLTELNAQRASEALDKQRHEEGQLNALQTQEVIVRSFKALVDYLDKRTSRTEVVNQLKEIGTPDALKVIPVLESLHKTLKTHENTDLSPVVEVLNSVLKQVEGIPKELPKQVQPDKPVDYSKQFAGLVDAVKSVEKVVKAQKLIAEAPIVNVPETQINVDAPDLDSINKELEKSRKEFVQAVKSIVIPEFNTAPMEKELKKLNKMFKDFLDAPWGGGGGGGGRVTPF